MVGYYRWFVERFSSIAVPLTINLDECSSLVSDECEARFLKLKALLTSVSILTLLIEVQGFTIYCDAFYVGLGCVLMSQGRVITYDSKIFEGT